MSPFNLPNFPLIRGRVSRYAFALASVALVFGIRMLLEPLTGTGAPFVLFFGAVLISSVLGNAGSGLVAVGLSAPIAAYFFVIKAGYPFYQAAFQALLYSIEGTVIVYLSATFTAAKRESEFNSQALSKTKHELEEAIRARDEFISIASHELKTPLTSLKIHAQFMRRSLRKGEDSIFTKQHIETLTEQTEKQVIRLERIVDDMLDIARVRSGKMILELEPFDLCELVKESVERMGSQFSEAGAGIPTLSFCEQAEGNWDRIRIEQVLNNLLMNAIKYGKHKPIEIAVMCIGARVRLSVRDHGMGVAPEAQEKIFNRFERAVAANEIGGLGLGLYISREIVSAHGGKIWVESKLGEGAAFFIDLPMDLPSENKTPVPLTRPTLPTDNGEFHVSNRQAIGADRKGRDGAK